VNEITINGKVGVPFGGINESAIVGDLEIQYRVNEDGTLNLRLIGRMILIILDKEWLYPRNWCYI
jgi:hypothetical protein